jgi:4-diphosphocytidyl-2-C-methyl-D-erythritol kinase
MLTLPSFAKINWTLEILGKRADGYHELRTLLQTVSVADELSFEPMARDLELHGNHPSLVMDETNLIYRAAKLLRDFSGCQAGVRITLDKRLPMAAGLGGGSSNAAVTLLALCKLWNLAIRPSDLFSLGSQLGADVPFFFLGGTCLGVGRGDEVYPTTEFQVQYLLLVNARVLVPTKEVYANLPTELTAPNPMHKIPVSLQAAYANWGTQATSSNTLLPILHNDLEASVLPQNPLLAEIKSQLVALNAKGVLMSGSGSTIFGFFDSEAARDAAHKSLQTTGWWCVPAHTISRSDYQVRLREVLA